MKKRRKRHSGVNGAAAGTGDDAGAIVVAFGTNTSEIRMYCPAEDKVTGVLAGGHEKGIRDFKFTPKKPAQEGWSIGGDGKLVQWNLRKGNVIRYESVVNINFWHASMILETLTCLQDNFVAINFRLCVSAASTSKPTSAMRISNTILD